MPQAPQTEAFPAGRNRRRTPEPGLQQRILHGPLNLRGRQLGSQARDQLARGHAARRAALEALEHAPRRRQPLAPAAVIPGMSLLAGNKCLINAFSSVAYQHTPGAPPSRPSNTRRAAASHSPYSSQPRHELASVHLLAQWLPACAAYKHKQPRRPAHRSLGLNTPLAAASCWPL